MLPRIGPPRPPRHIGQRSGKIRRVNSFCARRVGLGHWNARASSATARLSAPGLGPRPGLACARRWICRCKTTAQLGRLESPRRWPNTSPGQIALGGERRWRAGRPAPRSGKILRRKRPTARSASAPIPAPPPPHAVPDPIRQIARAVVSAVHFRSKKLAFGADVGTVSSKTLTAVQPRGRPSGARNSIGCAAPRNLAKVSSTGVHGFRGVKSTRRTGQKDPVRAPRPPSPSAHPGLGKAE